MTKAIVGIIGGSGVYRSAGSRESARNGLRQPWGEPSDALRFGRIGSDRGRVSAPPRARPQIVAVGHQLPRQYRRAETRRRHRHRFGFGLRLVQAGAVSGAFRARRSVHRSHIRARKARSSAMAASPMSRWPIRSRRCCSRGSPAAASRKHRLRQGRHLCLHRRPAIFLPRRIAGLQGCWASTSSA